MGSRIFDRFTPEGQRFRRELEKLAGMEVRVGFQRGEASEDDGTDICDIAAWNELGTVNMPSRPFLRKSVDENKAKINEFLAGEMQGLADGIPAEQILKEIGLFQKDLIQEKITNGRFAKNASSTIRKKGSSKPLIDTGRMRQSVNYVIKRKGSSD